MGMYDDIKVHQKWLDLAEDGLDGVPCPVTEFQTKDFDCKLRKFGLGKKGKIRRFDDGNWLDYYADGFSGSVDFYTLEDTPGKPCGWWEYRALFKLGRCYEVTRLEYKPREPRKVGL